MKNIYVWAALILGLPGAALAQPSLEGLVAPFHHEEHAHEDHAEHHDREGDHDNHADHHDHEPHSVALSDAQAHESGVTTAKAKAMTLANQSTLHGRLTLLPDGLTHVRARFDGIVKDVLVTTGQSVTKGQPLAVVESNESLKNFQVRAPQAGIVHSLQVTAGELTREGPLLTLINAQTLWAELQIFPSVAPMIKAGQSVDLAIAEQNAHGMIDHIVVSDNNSPVSLARIKIDNTAAAFNPGTWLSGVVTTGTHKAKVAVHSLAIHELENQPVVFVKSGDQYQARAVKLGLSAEGFTEVLHGLEAGEEYALKQSYLFKADAEKAGAEHHH